MDSSPKPPPNSPSHTPAVQTPDSDLPPLPLEQAEPRMALWLTLAVLVTLTAVKPLGGIAIIGTLGFTLAAAMQLYLPLWRQDKFRRDYDFVGLTFRAWRVDLKFFLILIAITFPPYIIGYHFFMTHGRELAGIVGLSALQPYLGVYHFEPHLPKGIVGSLAMVGWSLQMVATHTLGVALPEETFYRGYLQPQLEKIWKPARKFFGVPIGRAVLLSAFLFALGHFLGEWNPLRLGPFFPALIFAWQRNASGTIVGAIGYHAACNVLGEILFTLYQPG